MKTTFVLVLLLIVSCHTAPLSAPFGQQVSNFSVRPEILEQEDNPANKPHQTEPPPIHINPEKRNTFAYLSAPLRGTETRDHQALALPHAEHPTTAAPTNYHNHPHQQHEHYSSPELPHVNQNVKRTQPPSTVLPHAHNTQVNSNIPDSPRSHISHLSEQTANYRPLPPSTTPSSKNLRQTKEHVVNMTKRLTTLANHIMSKTAMYAKSLYRQIKSAFTTVIPKRNTTDPPTSHQKTNDAYTEGDVLNLVSDIITEIQMRTDDVRDHAQMLKENDRWDPNHVVEREHSSGVRDGPLLYMRTKVLISPETVVDAVMASTNKFFSSRNPHIPWNETSKLFKQVQARPSEELNLAN